MRTTRLRVILRDVTPEVVRVVDVPADAPLPELHWLLQAAIGWSNTHLHVFDTGEQRWGPDPEEDLYDDEDGVRLAALGSRFRYDYDFGDDWLHDVEVLGPGGDGTALIEASGACPTEDCGGPHGYAELLEAVADPRHPEHRHLLDWLGGALPTLDLAAARALVREVNGVVPDSVQMLLDLVGDGVRLTPGGRLPRALVREVQQVRPHWYPLDGRPASIEEDLYPLSVLHDVLRQVGLLRLSRGTLSRTKDSHDDQRAVRRLRSTMRLGTYRDVVTILTLFHLERSGPQGVDVLAESVFADMRPSWQGASGPLTRRELQMDLYSMSAYWQALDLVEKDTRALGRNWAPGPSACTLVPRVALACAREAS